MPIAPRIDFTGSDPQVEGSVNANYAVAVSATTYVFRCLVREDIPYTAGVMRPLEVIAPSGLVVSAQPPAAMAAGNVETSQRITDVILARAGESRTRADSGRQFGNHEQLDLRRMGSRAWTRLRLLRNDRRRHGRIGGIGWRERHPHAHDQ